VQWYGVDPSVRPICRLLRTIVTGLLLQARRAGDIDRSRWPPGDAAAWRTAAQHSSANADSVTLSADVGS